MTGLGQCIGNRLAADQADLALRARSAEQHRDSHDFLSRPNLDFRFQMDLVFVVNALPNDFDQLEHLVGLAPRMCDDEVRVLCAHLGTPDSQSFEPGLVDQSAERAHKGMLKTQRLTTSIATTACPRD